MKTDNIQALKDVLAGFSKAETEFDNYINTTRATDPDAEEMTIQLMGAVKYASLQQLFLHKKILPLQTVQSCYRKLCIVVTEIGALLLPKSEHSRLPKSVHLSLPFTQVLLSGNFLLLPRHLLRYLPARPP